MGKIRFLKTSSYYNNYLENYYEENLEIIGKSYDIQYNAIMSDCYGWSDFWKQHLEGLDNYEVMEIIVNAEHLQKKWAQENNVKYNNDNWKCEILESQISSFKPSNPTDAPKSVI